MKDYNKIKQLKPDQFKRLIGVKRDTFEAMLEVCELYHKRKKAKGGKPNKLSVSTQLLLMLEYYKEYRCMANMGFDYGVSESTVHRVIQEMEGVLLESGKFSLPSKRALYEDGGVEIEYIIIDTTESPIQRPKKSRGESTVGRRSNTPRKVKW